MQLKDYFQQHQSNMSDERKMRVYHQFLQHKTQKTGRAKRLASISKLATYGLMTVLLTVTVFSLYSQTDLNTFVNNGFQLNNPEMGYRTMAGGIGTIQNFAGTYTVVDNEGNKFATNIIQDGDTIKLQEGAYIEAKIGGSQTRIVGPAKILMLRDGDDYRMRIDGGTYVSLDNKSQKPDDGKLTLEKDDIIIPSPANQETIDVEIVQNTTTKTQTVSNKGETPVIVQQADEQKIIIESDTVAVTTGDRIVLQDAETFDATSELAIDDQTLVALITQDIDAAQTQTGPTPMPTQTWMTNDGRHIPQPHQVSVVNNLASTSIAKYNLKETAQALIQQVQGQEGPIQIVTSNIGASLNHAAQTLGGNAYAIDYLADIPSLVTHVQELLQGYDIPESKNIAITNYLTALNKIARLSNEEISKHETPASLLRYIMIKK